MDETQNPSPPTTDSGAVSDSVSIVLTGPEGETKQEASA